MGIAFFDRRFDLFLNCFARQRTIVARPMNLC